MRFRPMSRSPLLLAGIVWVAAVAFGSVKMLNYEFTPGAAGTPSGAWPAASGIRPDRQYAHLVMLVHPRCPCTRASIAELAQIMAHAQGLATATVLFYRPRQFPPGWERTDLWRSAAAIPGVTVLTDPEGREAQRFGAVTSGHVLLYDRAGQLLFTGGITGSRGHEGDNDGCDSVIRLLTGGPTAQNARLLASASSLSPRGTPSSKGGWNMVGTSAARRQSFVYGCPIRVDRVGSGK
jgi:hypothetical protein